MQHIDPIVAPQPNVMTGIMLKIASVCFFLSMATMLKASDGIPPGELVFFRSAFALVPIIIFLAYRRQLRVGIQTNRPLSHLWRGLMGVTAMSLGFFALTRLPLPESVAIGYTTPLLVVAFGAIFLHEDVRIHRWTAVIVGMIGVGIVLWPRLTVFSGGIGDGSGAAIGAIAAVAGCIISACITLLVRQLIYTERSATIVFYLSVICTLASLLSLPFGWVWPTPGQAALLIGAGICGGIGQILFTECYRHADVSAVAPFEYTSLLLSIAVGYVFFADVPTVPMLVGSAIMVGAGLFIVSREHKLGLERRSAKAVTPPET